ncbi:putative uncharacterized protein [Corynebacterium casei UCMA 3821]|uniref:Uncharacterized protein n=1 Tax=Corynebacterium casei UCMA 3821 TaxID=1110505 RepID=G7HXM2_9CORY|nr:putative uncharacterized protein [Corynebacterium casei UCMA 3821]
MCQPLDLDTVTTQTRDITAIQSVITNEIKGATALDIHGHPVAHVWIKTFERS